MKGVYLCLLIVLFEGCTKTEEGMNNWWPHLAFVSVNTSETAIKGSDIVSQVRCSARNLCYSFSAFEVTEKAAREYEVRAKANHPSPSQNVFCAEAIYTIDTTFKIPAPEKGQYVLHFYNGDQLFTSDTVQVN